jgi:hypothetical protein
MESSPMPTLIGTDTDRTSSGNDRLLRIDAPSSAPANKVKVTEPKKKRPEPDPGRRLIDRIRKENAEFGLIDYDADNPFK